jgi:phospholipid/cholesterol/gamma-HCH transport system substrate-binding protein
MPQPESPRQPRRNWLRVAVVAAGVLVALAIFAMIARRTLLRHEFDLTTLIDDSAGIAPSSPVLLNGIDVGHVVRVALSGSPDPAKTVRITMRFQRRILNEIPEDSTAAITSSNLLGDKYINISRGSHIRLIEPGAEIPSSPTQDIGTALSRASIPLDEINNVIIPRVNRIIGYIDSQQGTLGKLINNPSLQKHVTTVTGDQTQLMKNVSNGRGVLARLDEIGDEFQKPVARLDSIEVEIDRGGGSLGRFLNDPYTPTLTAEARSVQDEANRLIADFNAGNRTTDLMKKIQQVGDKLDATLSRIDSGQGTAGQFLVNPQLRDSLSQVSEQLNRLTEDFKKHPTRFVQLRFGLF